MNPPSDKKGDDLRSLRADWVGKVVRDPATPPGATTLVGYLGDSSKGDHVRVYLDHELSSFVDVPTADVLHAQRLPAEQSPLGEVIVWVKRDAKFVQGAETGQTSWFEGPIVNDQYAAAAAAMQAFGGGGFPGGPATFPPCGPWQTLPPQCPLPTLPPACPFTLPPKCPPITPVCPRTPVRPCPTQIHLCTVINCPPKSAIVPCLTQFHLCTVINCPPKSVVAPCITQNPICQTRGIVCTAICPRTQFCPVTKNPGCVNSGFVCTGFCPSAVDACPSAPGGCDQWFDPGEVVNPVINPGGWGGGMFG